jgi:hypothetical protein
MAMSAEIYGNSAMRENDEKGIHEIEILSDNGGRLLFGVFEFRFMWILNKRLWNLSVFG